VVPVARAAAAAAAAVANGTEVAAVVLLILLAGPAFSGPVSRTSDADTVDVVASERGFEPRVINVHKGEPIRLRLTTADREHCFAIDERDWSL